MKNFMGNVVSALPFLPTISRPGLYGGLRTISNDGETRIWYFDSGTGCVRSMKAGELRAVQDTAKENDDGD